MKIRAVMALIMVAFATGTACDDDVTGPTRPTGTYVLSSMRGQPLPAAFTTPGVPGVDGHLSIYRSGSIIFHGDSATYRLEISREWPRDTFTDLLIEETGVVNHTAGGRIELLRQEPGCCGGPLLTTFRLHITSWSNDTIVVTDHTDNMVFRRAP